MSNAQQLLLEGSSDAIGFVGGALLGIMLLAVFITMCVCVCRRRFKTGAVKSVPTAVSKVSRTGTSATGVSASKFSKQT